jgi:hypothetical protein
MSQDEDPIDATRRFEPIDPYNIPPHVPQDFEQQPHGAPQPARQGFKQRLTGLGPLKLALLGTVGVIVLGGAAWGTTAVLSSGSSSNSSSGAAAAAPATDPSSAQGQAPGAGATTGGSGKHAKAPKVARIKITELGTGSFTGTEAKGGRTVTVDYSDKTRFGTKAYPLSSDGLQVGMTVAVAGTMQGDTITATQVIVPAREARDPAADA